MTFYDIATVWIILGVLTYVDHVVYLWDVPSEYLKSYLTTFSFFVSAVVWWPLVLSYTICTRYRVHVAFRQFLKGNPTI